MVRSESVLRSLERARGHVDLITDPDIPLHEKAFKSMTLNTLDPADDFRLDKNKRGTHYDKDPMRYGALSTRDIEAAKPRPLYKYKTDGEGFLVKQFGGEKGMHPRVLIPRQTNRPEFSLKTDDIEGTKSEPKDIINKPRGTNPLCPEYILPCSREEIPPVPRFMRNTLDTSDIAGTNCGSLCKHPRRSRSSSAKASLSTTPRATSADNCPGARKVSAFYDDNIWDNRSLVTHDIDGSRPYSGQKQRVRKQKTRDHLLNVEDINRKKVINHKERDLSLKCEDVDGAKPHSLISSKSFRTTNYIEDIVGARPRKRFVEEDKVKSNSKSDYGETLPTEKQEDNPKSNPSEVGQSEAVITGEKKVEESGVKNVCQTTTTGSVPDSPQNIKEPKSKVRGEESLFKKNVRFGEMEKKARSKKDVSSLRRQTSQPFRCHRRPVSAIPSAKSTAKKNKFNTHIQCLSGINNTESEDDQEKWRPSNDMDIVKRNAHDINIANGHHFTRENKGSDCSSARSSRRSSKNTAVSSQPQHSTEGTQRQRPDSAFAVLQGNILAQKAKKISLITSRREKQQLESDISTIRNLM